MIQQTHSPCKSRDDRPGRASRDLAGVVFDVLAQLFPLLPLVLAAENELEKRQRADVQDGPSSSEQDLVSVWPTEQVREQQMQVSPSQDAEIEAEAVPRSPHDVLGAGRRMPERLRVCVTSVSETWHDEARGGPVTTYHRVAVSVERLSEGCREERRGNVENDPARRIGRQYGLRQWCDKATPFPAFLHAAFPLHGKK